jgi:hypothetical protein
MVPKNSADNWLASNSFYNLRTQFCFVRRWYIECVCWISFVQIRPAIYFTQTWSGLENIQSYIIYLVPLTDFFLYIYIEYFELKIEPAEQFGNSRVCISKSISFDTSLESESVSIVTSGSLSFTSLSLIVFRSLSFTHWFSFTRKFF